ncbi:MAG: Histone H1-like nucleoprotein, partial [Ilumatobacteraceae bacterium]|nr:Histone H1-like nucleoprotein [Ilumatobacteraceae bacterium]
ELLAAMAQHMETEEAQVYPALRQIDAEMGEEAQIEHGLARQGLATMAKMVGKPGFGAAVEMVQAGIKHHVEDEEQEAFPKLRKAFGPKSATRKPVSKKAANSKPPAQKAAAERPAAKRTAAKRPATKKTAAKKTAAKKTVAARR